MFTHQFDNAIKHKKKHQVQAKAKKHGMNDNIDTLSSCSADLDSEVDGDASSSNGEPEDGDLWEDEPGIEDASKPTGWNASAGLNNWIDDLAKLSEEELNKVAEASAPLQKVLSKVGLLSHLWT